MRTNKPNETNRLTVLGCTSLIWTGYTLGFKLIGTYQDEHPGETAATLVNANADRFRPD